MENSPTQISPNSGGCCGSTHAKIFEIFLIISFIIALAGLIINLVLTMCYFFYSYPIFFIEILLIALNFFCLILSILLRVWRSNGSVFNQNYSSSSYISLFILVFSIINILGSIVEDILFLLTMDIYLGKIEDSNDYEKKIKIFLRIFNKYEKMDEEEEKFIFIKDGKKLYKLLEILPWVSMNFNAFVQIINIIFITIIRKRINIRSDFGVPMAGQAQQSYSQNKMNIYGSSATNAANVKEAITKTTKKKSKNKKSNFDNVGAGSEQVDIVSEKKKKKKKSKKAKKRSLEKKEKKKK